MPVTFENPPDSELKEILRTARTIAVLGASANPEKASFGVMQKLLSVGYRVYPVNPRETEILGQKVYATLADVPEKIDIVDVFRRAEDTPQVAADAIAVSAKVLWLQAGIYSDEAAKCATAASLTVVMDTCITTAYALLRV